MKKTYIEIIYKNKKTEIKQVESRNYTIHPNILCFRYYDQNKINQKNNITKWIYNANKIKVEDIINNITNNPKYTKLINYIQTNNQKELYEIDKTYYKIPKNSTTYIEYSKKIETKKLKKINNIINKLEKNKNKKITVTYIYHGKIKTLTGQLTEIIDYYGIKVDTYTLPYFEENITIIEVKNELNQKLYHNKYINLPIEQQKENILGKILIKQEQEEIKKLQETINNYPQKEITRLNLIKKGLTIVPKNKIKEWIETVNTLIETPNGEEALNEILTTLEAKPKSLSKK